jgi:hypothetical protein
VFEIKGIVSEIGCHPWHRFIYAFIETDYDPYTTIGNVESKWMLQVNN